MFWPESSGMSHDHTVVIHLSVRTTMQASLRTIPRGNLLRLRRPNISPRTTGAIRHAHFLNASAKEFGERVRKRGDKVVLVDFYANWCGPCKMLSPLLEHVSEEGADVPAGSQPVDLVTVNTDVEIELAREFNVTSLPTVIAFRNGEQIGNFIGARPLPFVQAFIKKL